MQLSDLAQFSRGGYVGPNYVTLFSPVDSCHAALLYMIDNAQSNIDIAMYALTDASLIAALAAARHRGIPIRLTLDSSQFKDDNEKAKFGTLLATYGVEVSIGTSERGAIMHLKSGVIDGTITFTGSTNWSVSGESEQDNSLTVFNDPEVASQFKDRISAIHEYQKTHTSNGEPEFSTDEGEAP